jgi:hypothetical protein
MKVAQKPLQGRKLGLSNREMGEIIGKSEAHVRDLISLLRLLAEQQTAIAQGAAWTRVSSCYRGPTPSAR